MHNFGLVHGNIENLKREDLRAEGEVKIEDDVDMASMAGEGPSDTSRPRAEFRTLNLEGITAPQNPSVSKQDSLLGLASVKKTMRSLTAKTPAAS